jgi:hypothetical protein
MLTLKREYHNSKTTGVLTLPDGTELITLERPDLNNEPFVSCIPEGQYHVMRNQTGKHQWYGLLDVRNRSFIEIHTATRVNHLEGCIGLPSDADCDLLLDWFGDANWILEVTS